ncbi:MAG: hypothetical protein P8Q99_15470 [Paracoccaceae bacterium]|nr:hypothetical protein [Paracoccaceae bacterium]
MQFYTQNIETVNRAAIADVIGDRGLDRAELDAELVFVRVDISCLVDGVGRFTEQFHL